MADNDTKTTKTTGPADGANAASQAFTAGIDSGLATFDAIGGRMFDLAKSTATTQVDTFVTVVDTALDAQGELARSTSLPWVQTVADANASIVRSLTSAASSTARSLLK